MLLTVALLMAGLTLVIELSAQEPLDPLAQSVIDSLGALPRTTPEELLEAVIRASDVDAFDVALAYLARLDAALGEPGEARSEKLADLGEIDPVGLVRTARLLGSRDPEARQLIRSIQQAALGRHRDPAWLSRAAAALSAPTSEARAEAFDQLSRAGIDAIPAVVDVLTPPEPEDDTGRLGRALAWRLLHELGEPARDPLLRWLGSGDVDRWPGVIRGLAACGSHEEADFLLAPMLVIDSPPEVVEAATRGYRRLSGVTAVRLPSRTEAVSRLTARLATLLEPASLLPPGLVVDGQGFPDLTADDPVILASVPAAERGTNPLSLTDALLFDAESKRLVRTRLSRRFLRGLRAAHLARDLTALATDQPVAVRLAALARLEMATLAFPHGSEQARTASRAALSGLDGGGPDGNGPEGFDPELAAEVIDEARERGMHNAAAAALQEAVAWAAEEGSPADGSSAEGRPLPRPLREAIVRLLDARDLHLRYLAAVALADLLEKPFAGSSRVVETLAACAASRGVDHAVVAHPDHTVAVELASGLALHGFTTSLAVRGTAALAAAAADVDTRLVMLSARLGSPGPLEVSQLAGMLPSDEPLAMLVAIDPGDDAGAALLRRRLEQRLTGFEGEGLFWVTLTDRLPTLFEPETSPETGETLREPRLAAVLEGIDRESLLLPSRRSRLATARLERGGMAVEKLAQLARRGFDVEPAVETVARALLERRHTAGSVAMLAATDTARAQKTLVDVACRPAENPPLRQAAAAGLGESLDAFGLLLDDATVSQILRQYNGATDPVCRTVLKLLASIDPIVAAANGATDPEPAATQRR